MNKRREEEIKSKKRLNKLSAPKSSWSFFNDQTKREVNELCFPYRGMVREVSRECTRRVLTRNDGRTMIGVKRREHNASKTQMRMYIYARRRKGIIMRASFKNRCNDLRRKTGRNTSEGRLPQLGRPAVIILSVIIIRLFFSVSLLLRLTFPVCLT